LLPGSPSSVVLMERYLTSWRMVGSYATQTGVISFTVPVPCRHAEGPAGGEGTRLQTSHLIQAGLETMCTLFPGRGSPGASWAALACGGMCDGSSNLTAARLCSRANLSTLPVRAIFFTSFGYSFGSVTRAPLLSYCGKMTKALVLRQVPLLW